MIATEIDVDRLSNLRAAKFKHVTDDRHWAYICDECSRLGIHPSAIAVKMELNEYSGELEPQIITTLQVFRTIARNSGKWAGETSPQYCGADGAWVDVWTSD